MTEPLRQLGMVADESDLVAILRARMEEANVSQREMDDVLGLPGGYTGKRLAIPQIKYYGKEAFWNTCERLGVAVLLVEDPNATKRYTARMRKRVKQYARKDNHWANARTQSILREIAKKHGQDGAAARNLKLGPRRRKQIARVAAIARWNLAR